MAENPKNIPIQRKLGGEFGDGIRFLPKTQDELERALIRAGGQMEALRREDIPSVTVWGARDGVPFVDVNIDDDSSPA
jgi:hypothetical protein